MVDELGLADEIQCSSRVGDASHHATIFNVVKFNIIVKTQIIHVLKVEFFSKVSTVGCWLPNFARSENPRMRQTKVFLEKNRVLLYSACGAQ
jgi:hypothetical protein